MAVPITFDATTEYAPAFAGMIADAMFTDKVTVPAGTTHPFGTVIASVTATGVSALPVGTNVIEGVAIHEQQLGSRRGGIDGYVQYDAISVMRRGRVWGRASGACTKDAVAKYDPATGIFADAGTGTLPNARFLSANLTIPAVQAGTDTSHQVVLLEIHAPNVP